MRPGRYLVYTYAVDPSLDRVNRVQVMVPGAFDPVQFVDGPMPGNQFIVGVTHSVHDLTITGDAFEIDISGPFAHTRCNGFQILAVPEPEGSFVLALGTAGLVVLKRKRTNRESHLNP